MAASLLSPAAVSPLGSALGGGMMGAYNLAMYDPRSLAAMQQMQLGQSMLGEGLSSQSAYPAQAASRLGQALIGALLLKRGYGTLGQLGAGQEGQNASDLAAIANVGKQPPAATPVQPQAQAPPSGDLTLASAVHQLESSNSMAPGIRGDGGAAAGPMQVHQAALTDVNRAAGTNYTLDQLAADPELGKHVGDIYLALQQQRFPGHPELALAAYNAGPTATANAVASGQGVAALPQSTQQYVQRGMQMAGGAGGSGGQAPPAVGMANPEVSTNLAAQDQLRSIMSHRLPMDPVYRAAEAKLQSLQQQLQVGQWETLPNGTRVNRATGETAGAAAPLPHYVETSPGIYTDTTGTHAPSRVAPIPHYVQTAPGVYEDTTKSERPAFAPAQRFTTDVYHNVYQGNQGGGVTMVAPNPTSITGDNPESNAARVIATLGPLVQNHTATPEQIASYNVSYEQFLKPQIHVGPNQELMRVPTNAPPPGAPVPGQAQQAASPSGALAQDIQQPGGVQVLTGGARGPAAAQSINEKAGAEDVTNLSKEAAAVYPYHTILGTTSTIRSMLPQVTTGVGAEQRLAASRVLGMLGFDENAQKELTGTSAPAGELLQKKLFELSTGAVRTMGAREPGSVLQMFQKNYPNMTSRDMTIDAMTRLLDLDQIFKEDELTSRSQYIQSGIHGLSENKPYGGLVGYKPPDPRLYQAAALASGGMPFKVWSSGLSPTQQTDALRLAARVYPDASALDDKGVRHVFKGGQQ